MAFNLYSKDKWMIIWVRGKYTAMKMMMFLIMMRRWMLRVLVKL